MSETRKGLSGRFVSDWLKPQWGWFAIGALLAAVTAAAFAGYALVIRWAGDLLNANDPRIFVEVPAIIIGLVILRSVTLYGQTQANNHGVQNAVVAVQERLFARLIEGDFARLQSAASGE